MPDRIANLASSNLLMTYLAKAQNRINDLQYQVTNQAVSPNYQGISQSSQYLLSLETSRDNIAAYMKLNQIMTVKLDTADTSMTGILDDITDIKKELKTFNDQSGKNQTNIDIIQKAAFNTLKSLEAYMNTSVGGSFLFAGARGDSVPVDMGLTTLADFQAKFDGSTVTYPTTRDAHIENFTLNRDPSGQTNWLTFKQDDDGVATSSGVSSITATTAQFTNVSVGTTIEVTGSGSNNGTYTVKAITNGGTTIEVETRMLTVEANNTAAVITKPDGTSLNAANFTDLSFDRAANRITVGAASLGTNALSSLTVGTSFTISGTAENDGTYTVAAVALTGNTVDIVPSYMTDEGTAATPTLSFVGTNQTFTVNVGDDSISAAAGTYSDVTAGMKITFANTVGNNSTFTVTSVASDGSSITVSETVAAEGPTASDAIVTGADGTVASRKYYFGDELAQTHRVDEQRSFKFDINGLDPAFEKVIRALSIVAQGAYGTEGGLDQNISRAENAIYLLESAYDGTVSGTPPYGAELTSSVQSLISSNSYFKVLITQTTASHSSYSGFLNKQISNIEDSDPLVTITQALNQQTALEASYQVIARIRDLSLVKYL